MTVQALKFISDSMDSLNIPYAFMQWNNTVPDMYFVGEYSEMESMNEDGMQQINFTLNGFTRGSWLSLEQAKESIERNIAQTAILDNESGIAVFYNSALVVPTGDAELKRIQINLTIKEWKVN